MSRRGSHAIVLEAARRVQPFVLQEQVPRIQSHITRNPTTLTQLRLPFPDRHD